MKRIEQAKRVGKWLGDRDSHTIYAASILDELAPLGITYDAGAATMTIASDDSPMKREVRAPFRTHGEMVERIKMRGLGGSVRKDTPAELPTFTGWEIAYALCDLFNLGDPGSHLMGRGWIFRARLAAIVALGDS